MKERIWSDLCSTILYLEYLGLYISKIKKTNKIIETILLGSALVGIAGWNKFAEYHMIWTILLITVTSIRILKSRFMVSESEIATFQSVKNFYNDHFRDLDDLWYRYRNNKLSETQVEKIFKKINEQERLMMKIEKHEKLVGKEPLYSQAEKIALQKLKKYK